MNKRRGITLIEVLFAIAIVGVSASILVATTPIASMSRYKADQLNKASGLAQKELEAVRGLGYGNITAAQLATSGLIDSATPISTNTYSFTNADSGANDNPAKILPTGKGTVKLEQPATDLKRVTVQVTWNERGTTRTFTLATVIANM